MPVPKRKTSKSRRDQRSACKFLRPQIFMACLECGTTIMPHVVCMTCGYYKGRKIFDTKRDRTVKRSKKQADRAKHTPQTAHSEDAQTQHTQSQGE